MNFIKSVGIYQLFILQIAVTIVEGNSQNTSQDSIIHNIQYQVIEKAQKIWGSIIECLCIICNKIGFVGKDNCENTCKEFYVAIPVVVFLFIFVFGIICLICCKCCSKKSCCKKKENDESDIDYNNFIMGPDGQMYSTMYQEQMMQPDMFSAGTMYPQMYQGQMFYPQMVEQGMQQPEMYNQEIQQTVTQEPKKKRKKKKRSSKKKNTNDDALLVGYDMM